MNAQISRKDSLLLADSWRVNVANVDNDLMWIGAYGRLTKDPNPYYQEFARMKLAERLKAYREHVRAVSLLQEEMNLHCVEYQP